jgi:hypothetical protein
LKVEGVGDHKEARSSRLYLAILVGKINHIDVSLFIVFNDNDFHTGRGSTGRGTSWGSSKCCGVPLPFDKVFLDSEGQRIHSRSRLGWALTDSSESVISEDPC